MYCLFNPFNPILVKKLVKPLVAVSLFLLSLSSSFAQFKPTIAGEFAADMKKVIRDYPHQFNSMLGAVIDENPQYTNYECSLAVQGAERVTITRYSATNKQIYSWQALMFTSDDFETARARFKSLFQKFNNMAVKMDYGMTFYLKGKYQEPTESKTFASTVLRFEQADRITDKMRLEVSLQYELMEWKVRVLIYEKDREDTERGEMVD